jgi:signal transduction histidine kinase
MNEDLILVEHICSSHHIESTFFTNLNSYGLVELIMENNIAYIHIDHLMRVEKMIRLHYDLGVNLEGIDVIANLLEQIENLQKELNATQNKLHFYGLDRIQ